MRFPTYQSTANISTQIVKPKSFETSFKPLIKAGQQLSKEWQNATNITETNQAYNNIEQGTNDILKKAEQETDYKNQQKYLDELEKLRGSQEQTFSDKQTSLKFQRVADSSVNRAIVKTEGMFRDKMIKHQQGEVVRSQALNKQAFMGGDLNAKEINKGILKENYDNGFISDSVYQKGLEDMNNWELERTQQDVATNPQFVLDNIDRYGLDEVQKADIRKSAESLVKRNNELSVIKQLELEDLTTTELVDVVNSDMTEQEKTQAIQTQVLLGNVSSTFAKQLGDLMVSEKAVNAVTKDDVMADIILRTYDLNAMADVDPQGYLKGSQNIKDEIIKRQASGELTQEDASSLNRQIRTLTSGKTAESTSFISYNFGQVKDTFDVQLPPEYRGKAMRQLFYAVDGKDLTDKEYQAAALKVVDDINQERRGMALRRTQEPATINNEFLAKNNITMEQVRAQAAKSNMTEAQVIQILRQKLGE